jgi:5-formyltetrahydrofolate cyclo-ligase
MASQEKIDLRKAFVAQRDALDSLARKRASSMIRQRLFQHPAWRDAEHILCYVSFRSEVETHPLIQEGIRFKKRMHVPLFHPIEPNRTSIAALKRWGDLQEDEHSGILEPRPDARVVADPTKIQLVLIPGAVFDRQGGRIGFGGGYFDRLLAGMPQAKRIGLAYSGQLSVEALPREPHDVLMHSILTEKEEIIPA